MDNLLFGLFVGLLVLIFGAVIVDDVRDSERKNTLSDEAYCQEHKDDSMRYLPARCMKYFNN